MSSISSPVEIGRLALGNIGARSNIESLSENSTQARKVQEWYDISRRQTLEKHNWSFARKTGSLAGHPAKPSDNWAFRYSAPFDMLTPRRLVNPLGRRATGVAYSREIVGIEQTILTDLDQASLVYTANIEYVPLFTPSFTLALSIMLGANMAPSLIGDGGHEVRGQLLQEFNIYLATSADSDANSEEQEEERDPAWIRER